MYVSIHHKLALLVIYSNMSSTFIFDKPFRKNGHRQKKGFLELVLLFLLMAIISTLN